METYELFSADDGYVPETITTESLKAYEAGGEIISISSTLDDIEINYAIHGEEEKVEVISMDTLGNRLSFSRGENGKAIIPRHSGFMIVSLYNDGKLIDTRTVK